VTVPVCESPEREDGEATSSYPHVGLADSNPVQVNADEVEAISIFLYVPIGRTDSTNVPRRVFSSMPDFWRGVSRSVNLYLCFISTNNLY
jgi:hypothetical protein